MKMSKRDSRDKRKKRIRKKVFGTATRPRLSVFRSRRHIEAQLIDDVSAVTLVAATTVCKERTPDSGNIKGAKKIGEMLAEKAKAKNIEAVVFDRGGFKYHGRVKALADGAREKGLKF